VTRLRHPLVAGLLATLVLAGLAWGHRCGWRLPVLGDFVERLERRTADLRFSLRGPVEPGGEIVLLVFDDRTFEADAGLFERRAGWARVIEALRRAGPRVIGVDALFNDPERLLSPELIGSIQRYVEENPRPEAPGPADDLVRRVHHETRGDQQLAAAVREAGNVVLALHIGYAGAGRPVDTDVLAAGRFGQTVPGPHRPEALEGVIASLPVFCRAARALGVITVWEDESHTVREMRMVFGHDRRLYVPFALQLAAVHQGISRGRIAYLGTDHTVRLGGRTLQLNEQDGFWLNFRGPAGTFPTHSVIDLVEGRLAPGALRDRIVLLGITQFGHDRAMTPFDRVFPAVELQATAVDNILAGDPIRRSPPWLDALICLGLGVLVSLLFWRRLPLSPWLRSLGAILVLGAYLAASQVAFASADLWLFWVGPIGVCLLVGGLCLALSYFGEGLERRRLRHAFGHYLSGDVIHQLLEEPGKLSLGGERRELTVLFSDIRGFTNLAERADPEELVSLLNTYFTPMTRAILAEGGFLDKYIGDALMAVFGAPLFDPRHPAQALGGACRMHAALGELRPVFEQRGVAIDIGVGINTGEMVVGNMGSEERFDYTVVGDTVNLASRLEGLTKVYGVFCLAGERTRALAGEGFVFREVDRVQVKGKSLATPVHELVAGPQGSIAAYRGLEVFAAALGAFRRGAFGEARRGFEAFSKDNPDDTVCRLYLERLAGLGDEPPDGWDGVSVFLTK